MNLIHTNGGIDMKKIFQITFILLVLMTLSCNKKDTTGSEETAARENSQLKEFRNMYSDSMQNLVNYILDKDVISLSVYEEEKGYYIGFVELAKDMKFVSGYDAEGPIVVQVDSYSFEEERMVIILSKSLVREKNGEQELYFTGILEAVVTKDALFSYYKPYFEGTNLKAPLSVKAKIIKEPH